MNRKINDEELLQMVKEGKLQKDIAEHFGVSPAAICLRLKRLLPKPDLSGLSPKRQDFVIQVAQGKTPTAAARDAYDCKDGKSAKVIASNLMKDDDVTRSIKEIMDHAGLTRSYRVHRLKHWIDCPDGTHSLKALDTAFRLDGIVEKSITINYMTQLCKASEDYGVVPQYEED